MRANERLATIWSGGGGSLYQGGAAGRCVGACQDQVATASSTFGAHVVAVVGDVRLPPHLAHSCFEEEMKLLNIRAHRTLPEWNYTIKPYAQKQLRNV